MVTTRRNADVSQFLALPGATLATKVRVRIVRWNRLSSTSHLFDPDLRQHHDSLFELPNALGRQDAQEANLSSPIRFAERRNAPRKRFRVADFPVRYEGRELRSENGGHVEWGVPTFVGIVWMARGHTTFHKQASPRYILCQPLALTRGSPMSIQPPRLRWFSAFFFAFVSISAAIPISGRVQQSALPTSSKDVEIVFLGTGTPVPNADRQGPSLAIVANGKAYIVDAGSGVVRQANSVFQRGIPGLQPHDLDIAFLTHLHSDHTLGLPDLILTPWILERTKPLRLYGPEGTAEMAAHLLEAYKEDIRVRTTGLEGGNATGYKVDAHDVQPGNVYQDGNVRVKAFLVKHGSWNEALGYRFDTDGKSIVISGDTAPAESVVEACSNCDVLIHEVYSGRGQNPNKPSIPVEEWMKYEVAFHTSALELGEIAARAKPKVLILTHWTLLGNAKENDMVREIRRNYSGSLVVARDLDVIAP